MAFWWFAVSNVTVTRTSILLFFLSTATISFSSFVANAFVIPDTVLTRQRTQPHDQQSSFIHGSDFCRQYQPLHLSSQETAAATTTTTTTKVSEVVGSCTKLRRLKDRMWVRETLEDITAAEFACSIVYDVDLNDASIAKKAGTKLKRAVDFENLLSQLDRRVEEMCVQRTYQEATTADFACYPLDHSSFSNIRPDPQNDCWALQDNVGMGSVTYTLDQRDTLMLRILESRQALLVAMSGRNVETKSSDDLDKIREQLKPENDNNANTGNSNKKKKEEAEPFLYVREDGTVDWDGALQDRAALKKFGTAVWARINGQNPEMIEFDSMDDAIHSGGSEQEPVVTAKIMETQAIREKKETLDVLKSEYAKMDIDHTKLLSSAVDQGAAVANVNFATLRPELRFKIRSSAEALEQKKYEISFQTLNYELERIYTYLDAEIGNVSTKGYIPLSDRLTVAEFGLLESQIETVNRQKDIDYDVIDSDVLSVILDQTIDFKRRLGIDYSVTGFKFEQEAVQIKLNKLIAKIQEAGAFIGKGSELLFDDIVFSSSLVGRALQGYTLKPREVRTLRRTVNDMITVIPVAIIWITPITPIGHVIVFGTIQRFFPDFFPSPFTERRQNLLSLYETTEFSALTIEENWVEKIGRLMSAIGYSVADTFMPQEEEDEQDDNNNNNEEDKTK